MKSSHGSRQIRLAGIASALALTVGMVAGSTALAQDASPAASMAAAGAPIKVGLITKTEVNPFFVTMREGAQAAADRARCRVPDLCRCIGLRHRGPDTCIENQVAAGVTTILLTPGDPLALADTVTKARERVSPSSRSTPR